MLVLLLILMTVTVALSVSVKKNSSGGEDTWEKRLSEHQIRGRTGVASSGLKGKGSHRRSVLFTGTGSTTGTVLITGNDNDDATNTYIRGT